MGEGRSEGKLLLPQMVRGGFQAGQNSVHLRTVPAAAKLEAGAHQLRPDPKGKNAPKQVGKY